MGIQIILYVSIWYIAYILYIYYNIIKGALAFVDPVDNDLDLSAYCERSVEFLPFRQWSSLRHLKERCCSTTVNILNISLLEA